MSKAPIAVGFFSILAAVIATVAGITLLWPGTPVDVIWGIRHDDVHQQMLALGWPVGAGLIGLAIITLAIAIGSFQRRRWAWGAAVAGLGVNGVADLARLATGQVTEGVIGFLIAGLIIIALSWPSVRAQFSR